LLYSRNLPHWQRHTQTEIKGIEVNRISKQAGVTILISDKTDFNQIRRDKESPYLLIGKTIHQNDRIMHQMMVKPI
jgi:hypothetical protein